ncbi:unnamed protein product [Closterium sp. Yama58-4]|nr:unnamed protein product [Closterium sp. Yama58-4]
MLLLILQWRGHLLPSSLFIPLSSPLNPTSLIIPPSLTHTSLIPPLIPPSLIPPLIPPSLIPPSLIPPSLDPSSTGREQLRKVVHPLVAPMRHISSVDVPLSLSYPLLPYPPPPPVLGVAVQCGAGGVS